MQNQEDNLNSDALDNDNEQKDTDIKAEKQEKTDEKPAEKPSEDDQLKDINDKYLRLYSEFDNYRKRTIKERSELIKTAAEEVFKAILPVMDDLERAIKANEGVKDPQVIKEGLLLISNKLKNAVQQKGLTAFETQGESFNPDTMEAITHMPAARDEEKGKVLDEVEKGYKLGDKVIRFAKVVVGQ